jgi:hypothetical protein
MGGEKEGGAEKVQFCQEKDPYLYSSQMHKILIQNKKKFSSSFDIFFAEIVSIFGAFEEYLKFFCRFSQFGQN